MGSNQFQKEFIEYLQERNVELLNKLNQMKENYENQILSKDLNKHYLISTLEDVLKICTVIPQEIDFFFDKMTAAISAFKSILMRKSELVQLKEKISKVLSSTENYIDNFAVHGSDLIKECVPEGRVIRKVKVSPMINGHIISTEPRIFLSRMHETFSSGRRNAVHELSPIIEASPDTSIDPLNFEGNLFREVKIPLERINLNKMSYNYVSEESPKSRFKGPKTWKKSLSSNVHQSDNSKNTACSENNENLTKKPSPENIELSQPSQYDPLEGPSWLYEGEFESNSSPGRFIDFRRRKHRFATVFDEGEDCNACQEKKAKKSIKEGLIENYGDLNSTNDDKKEFEEIKNKISEGGDDFISESFINPSPENDLFLQKKNQSKKREISRESRNKIENAECNNNLKSGNSPVVKNEKEKNTPNTSDYLSFSDDTVCEEIPVEEIKKKQKFVKKQRLKSSFKKGSTELSLKKTSNKSENDIRVELENSKTAEEILPKKSRSESSGDKNKSENRNSDRKSRSSLSLGRRSQGRKKRKAAPSFKLVEPTLKTKLRRS